MALLQFALFPTAIGACAVAWRGDASDGLVGSQLPAVSEAALRQLMQQRFLGAVEVDPPPPVREAMRRVQRLLAGETADHQELLAVPLDDSALPDFECQALWLTRHIPVGQTRTYGELATALGEPGAARAVGRAQGRNPFAPIVPCHRVIGTATRRLAGTDDVLTGFSAPGGVETKRRLLLIEARAAGQLAGEQQALF